MNKDPIQAAIAYANDDMHGGAGFTLALHFMASEMIEVDVIAEAPGDYMLRRREPASSLGDGAAIYPNIAALAYVEILW